MTSSVTKPTPSRTSVERLNSSFFAIDVEPEGNYEEVCERLAAWESAGLLEYETCEARIVGSFDDAPLGLR